MRILSTHKSAFERQLREKVLLEHFAGPQILNSKLEYTRCGIPKMELKIGNKEAKESQDVKREKAAIELIKMRFKSENKRPKEVENEDQKYSKKVKMDPNPKNSARATIGGASEPKNGGDFGPLSCQYRVNSENSA